MSRRYPDRAGNWAYRNVLSKDPCCYCGKFFKATRGCGVDHITPKSKGGTDHWTNLTSACRACNVAKKNSSILGFLVAHRLHPIWTTLKAEANEWRNV